MPPFDDVPGVDLSGTEILVVNVASDGGPGSSDRGDLVICRPLGWPWGRLEHPVTRRNAAGVGVAVGEVEKFRLIVIPDRPFQDMRGMAHGLDSDAHGIETKSRTRFDFDALPASIKGEMENDGARPAGVIERPFASLRPYLIDKRTGSPVDDPGRGGG